MAHPQTAMALGRSFYGMAWAMRAHCGMRVRPATWACHQADLNAREKLLGIGVEMHVPRPT
jgi:hypothetical protein